MNTLAESYKAAFKAHPLLVTIATLWAARIALDALKPSVVLLPSSGAAGGLQA